MQKVIILLLIACSVSKADTHQAHLHKLKKEFPYGLLTDDFGILNKTDLKINSCIAGPIPFSEQDKISPYPYWQCFEMRNSKMTCERGHYDPHEKAVMSMLVISGTRDEELHEFIIRRPLSLESCLLYKKDWHTLTKNEKYVCFSGAEHSRKVQGDKVKWTWIFGRYKTRKGCDSYFEGECSDTTECKK